MLRRSSSAREALDEFFQCVVVFDFVRSERAWILRSDDAGVVVEGVDESEVSLLQSVGLCLVDIFALSMKGKVEGLMLDRMDQNQEIVTRYLNDPEFQSLAFELIVKRIYDEIRKAGGWL
jgi:hypothetical protein